MFLLLLRIDFGDPNSSHLYLLNTCTVVGRFFPRQVEHVKSKLDFGRALQVKQANEIAGGWFNEKNEAILLGCQWKLVSSYSSWRVGLWPTYGNYNLLIQGLESISPTFMEVENGCIWKVTNSRRTNFSLNHDHGILMGIMGGRVGNSIPPALKAETSSQLEPFSNDLFYGMGQ